MTRRPSRRAILLGAALAISAVAIGWPLFASAATAVAWQEHAGPVLAAAILPVALALLLDDLIRTEFGPRVIAVVAALAALAAMLRLVSPGVAGIEPIWLVVLVAGRALGAAEGFAVGVSAILASALATGGVGPWLPYQMAVAGAIGVGAGWLPRSRKGERWWLAGYGALSGLLFGVLMNLWFWPTAIGLSDAVALDFADNPLERVASLIRFSILTSLGWDAPRAVLNAVLVLLAGGRLLKAVRRVGLASTA